MKLRLTASLLCGPALIWLTGCNSAQPTAPQPGGSAADTAQAADDSPAGRLSRAERLLRDGNPDEALLITDELLRDNPRDVGALRLAARGNVVLFQSGRQGQQSFLLDAVRNAERAIDVDPADPTTLMLLADLKLKQAEFADGRDAAVRAAELLKGKGPAAYAPALLLAADNEMQIFVDARRSELQERVEAPGKKTELLARDVLGHLEHAKAGAPGEVATRAALVYQWMNRPADALRELEAGIAAEPGHTGTHDAFIELYRGQGQAAQCAAVYRRMVRQTPKEAMLLWHAGRAEATAGDEARAASKFGAADRHYEKAANSFGAYRAMRPDHAEATDHWRAIATLSRARCAIENGDPTAARRLFDESYQITPVVADRDENGYPKIRDSFGGNYEGGLFLLGRAIAEGSTATSLEDSLKFFESVIAKHPDRFGAMYNNAALSARDLGVAVVRRAGEEQRAKAEAEAMKLWEKSYSYYAKAVELEPTDPRIANDCGLMLIYHLHREYDRADELFQRAIKIGQVQLDELADDAGDDARQFLEEAVGDAYQNRAILARQTGKPFSAYRGFCEKAVEYYPYKRREAYALLRTKGAGDAAAANASGATRIQNRVQGSGTVQKADPRKAAFEPIQATAAQKAGAGDFDGALLALDEVAKKFRGYAPFHFASGKYSLQYARQSIQNAGDVGQIDGLLADAERQLRKSFELDSEPVATRLVLVDALNERGKFQEAADLSEGLLSHVRSMGGVEASELHTAHRQRALANMQVFVKAKQAGKSDDAALRRLRTSFKLLEDQNALSEKDVQLWTTAEQWAGANEKAAQITARAQQRNPSSQWLITHLLNTTANAGKSDLAIDALKSATDATTIWYRGKARFNRAQELWTDGKPKDAAKVLDQGKQDFELAKQKNPQFAQSSNQWIALTLGSKGTILLSDDQVDAAQTALLAAVKASPDQLEADLGGGGTIKRSIMVLADRFRLSDLGKTELIYRAFREVAPEDSTFANNHGLFARDHGVNLARRRKADEARELFEQSYKSYTKASALEPDNVRLLNDRALILVHYLKRDWDTAKTVLREAITKGVAQLKEDPPTDATELRNLQEAVGDAYGNLGLLHQEHEKDLTNAAKAYEQAITYYPFARRAASRRLARVKAQQAKDKVDGDEKSSGDGSSGGGNGG